MLISDHALTNQKPSKPTLRNAIHIPASEQTSTLSLNSQDLRCLMKKKQKQYQNNLQIQDAQRVYNLLAQIHQKKKQNSGDSLKTSRLRRKIEVQKYNTKTIEQFNKEWNTIFAKTYHDFQEIETSLEQQHQMQLLKAIKSIEQAKNGKNLQNIKFSKQVIELQDQLKRLVKSQRYEQSYVVNKKLDKAKTAEMKKFMSQLVHHEEQALHKLKKKQQKQKQTMSLRLNQLYQKQKARHRDQSMKLTNNLKTYQIDLTKIESRLNRIDRDRKKKEDKDKDKDKAKRSIVGVGATISASNKLQVKNVADKQFALDLQKTEKKMTR